MKNILNFPDMNIIEEQASVWIVKFEGDERPTDADIEALETWMSQSPAHKETLLRLASSWGQMDLLSELVLPAEINNGIQVSWFKQIKMAANTLRNQAAGLIKPLPFRLATVSLILAFGFTLSFWPLIEQENPSQNVYVTALGEQLTHNLQDGSTLWLNTDSKVEIDFNDERRKITLYKGEAHFVVFPDKERPFEVYAGSKLVRAVGTAFSVFMDIENVKVTVTHGKVDLALIKEQNSTKNTDDGSILTAKEPELSSQKEFELLGSLVAGQSIVIPPAPTTVMDDVLNIEPQELSRDLSWLNGHLVFAGETLSHVVNEVSRYTPLRIEIADAEIENMRIGGQFLVGETEALFDVLESGFGVNVKYLDNNHVLIHAKK